MNSNSEHCQFDASSFDYIKKIGQGACSVTWKAQDKENGNFYALKIIQNSKLGLKNPEFLSFLSQAKHFACPNVVIHYHSYSDVMNLYLVQELVEGGTLFHKLFMEKVFDESTAFNYFSQILTALEYLNSFDPPLAHGDLRLENVLLTKKMVAKVNFVACGKFLAQGICDLREDLWGLGIVLYEMLCGCSSLSLNQKKTFFGEFCSRKIPKNLSSEVKDLLEILICRPESTSLEQIKSHPWVKNEGICFSNKDEDNHSTEKDDRESIFSTNFTEVHATRESLTTFELKEDIESEIESMKILEYRVLLIQSEKKELEESEKKLRTQLENTDLQLIDLETETTGLEILDQLESVQKELFEKRQMCKMQKIYLHRLKKQTDHSTKELENKETQLKALIESVKSLNLGISKIKAHRSVDLSSLRINLDVLQYKIGEKTQGGSKSAEITAKDLKELIAARTESIKFLTKSDYKHKIHKCLSKASEFNQKIADLNLNYELERGKVLQNFSKIKEKLNLIIKKNREDYFKSKVSGNEMCKQNLSANILEMVKEKNRTAALCEQVQKARERVQELKQSLNDLYSKIKITKKDRFRNERKIDSKQLEIDDLKVDIHSIKSSLGKVTWKSR